MLLTNKMLIFSKIDQLSVRLDQLRKEGKTIGFVPTMGALHEGHISLVHKARVENDIVVVSIFVNPTQFNNPEDLKNYPRTPEEDQLLLEKNTVDILFSPEVSEIYNQESIDDKALKLDQLAAVMEGAHRPGHFAGVVQVVARLFNIVKPHSAYFGEKDFQQLAIIRFMNDALGFPVRIVPCPTVREKSGLAMSSRNLRLSAKGLEEASNISRALFFAKENRMKYSPEKLKEEVIRRIESTGYLKTEYVEVAEESTLLSFNDWKQFNQPRCFVAVYCESIRLIDNIPLY